MENNQDNNEENNAPENNDFEQTISQVKGCLYGLLIADLLSKGVDNVVNPSEEQIADSLNL